MLYSIVRKRKWFSLCKALSHCCNAYNFRASVVYCTHHGGLFFNYVDVLIPTRVLRASLAVMSKNCVFLGSIQSFEMIIRSFSAELKHKRKGERECVCFCVYIYVPQTQMYSNLVALMQSVTNQCDHDENSITNWQCIQVQTTAKCACHVCPFIYSEFQWFCAF